MTVGATETSGMAAWIRGEEEKVVVLGSAPRPGGRALSGRRRKVAAGESGEVLVAVSRE